MSDDPLLGPYDHIDLHRLKKRKRTETDEKSELKLPPEPRIQIGQHTLVIANTGAGKTNIIRWRIMDLLPRIAEGKASLILIDPMDKGILTEELLHLRAIWDIRDRVVHIEPFDAPASINIFQLYEQSGYALRQAIEKVERTLGTVAVDITNNQAIPFKYALHALFALPEDKRDIFTLQQILAQGIGDLPIDAATLLEPAQRYYGKFKRDNPRAIEVVEKLNSFINDPIFESLFSTRRASFDIFEHCQAGKLIIIDCSRAPEIYGQFWIEEVTATIGRRLERIKRKQWVTPTTLLIDEAQEYIGTSKPFSRMLSKARESLLSAMVAFHNLAQIPDEEIVQAIVQQTQIKLSARTFDHINLLCSSMGATEPMFVKSLPKYHFAYHEPDMPTAEAVKLPLVDFTAMEQIAEADSQELRRIAMPANTVPPAPAISVEPEEPSELVPEPSRKRRPQTDPYA